MSNAITFECFIQGEKGVKLLDFLGYGVVLDPAALH